MTFRTSALLYLFASGFLACYASAIARSKNSMEATFILPASPTVTRSIQNSNPTSSHELTYAKSQIISSGYGLYYHQSSSQLQAKKKKAAPAAAKKVQVKLLKHVPGSGQAGEVILVTPAFFNNKLRPNQSAEIISNEEVADAAAKKEAKEKEEKAKATELREILNDVTLQLKRKAGPDGQLFGGIGPKIIMSELQSEVTDVYLNEKWVKVAEVLDENEKKIRGDIKHTGEFRAKIALLSGISAKIGITVEAEE